MSGKEILADTNILLYLLRGDDTIAEWLQNKRIYISFITISLNLPLLTADKQISNIKELEVLLYEMK